MKPIKLLTATAIGLALLLSGCGGPADNDGNGGEAQTASTEPDYNEQPYENLKDGGTLTSGDSFSGTDTQGNPANVNFTETTVRLWRWYNPVAINYSPTGDVQINPDYYDEAEAETVDGKQVVTIKINPKATFNDGTPIDWRSIETIWKTGNGENPEYQITSPDGTNQIESVEPGENDKEAIVTFSSPYTAWPGLFSLPMHPELMDPENFNNAYNNKVQPQWGAGPYTVESYDPNSKRLIFKKNEKWWGKPGKLDRRIFVDIPEAQARANAFRAGQIDFAAAPTAELENQMRDTPDSERRSAADLYTGSLFLNGRSDKLQDLQVRKAVFEAVNREQIAQIRYQGLDYQEPLPGSLINYSFSNNYEDNVAKVLTPGEEEAKKTLDAAGWALNGEGVREKDGSPLELEYVVFNERPTTKAMAQSLVASMKNVGITLSVNTLTPADWISTMNQGRFDLVLSGYGSGSPFGLFSLSQFYGSKAEGNITRVGTPELDAKIEDMLKMSDPEAQAERANELEQEGLALYGSLPLINGPETVYVKKGLANVGPSLYLEPLPETIGWQKD